MSNKADPLVGMTAEEAACAVDHDLGELFDDAKVIRRAVTLNGDHRLRTTPGHPACASVTHALR